jgi:hypothetical protein
MQYYTKITIWRKQRVQSTEQQARVDKKFRMATELCRMEQNDQNGNSLKGSNITH